MSEKIKAQLLQMDLYKLLDVEESSTLEQIKKAYRKKALELHPDKNLSNKEEAEKKFVELGKAFEILADESARSAYDAVRKAKREKQKRDEQLDDKRRKLKQDLESREKAAREREIQKHDKMRKSREEENLQHEIDRLRKEGSKLLEEETNFINEQIRLEKVKAAAAAAKQEESKRKLDQTEHSTVRIKISWPSSTTFDENSLKDIFSKFGNIETIVVGVKPVAIVEYLNVNDALKCLDDEKFLNETYSLSLKCMDKIKREKQEPKPSPTKNDQASKTVNVELNENKNNEQLSFEDMEMQILKKLKAASSAKV